MGGAKASNEVILKSADGSLSSVDSVVVGSE
jgi:hypothetical protein